MTKARSNFVAYEPPPARRPGTRGRPRRRGARVEVAKRAPHLSYRQVKAVVGREERTLLAATLDLVWGRGLWVPVRVVVVLGMGTPRPQVLVTTDVTPTAREVVEVHAAGRQIECSFRDMKTDLFGLCHRIWSRAVSELDLFARAGAPDRLESVTDPGERRAVLACAEAIERYVACSCVALGILQVLALAERGDGFVARSSSGRTPKASAVSVRTMREFLRDRVSGADQGMSGSPMMRFIRERLVGEEGYVPRPSQLARMAVG